MSEVIIPKKNLAWRIRASFAGSLPPHEYVTPDIRHNDPGWGNEVFNRQIECLEFFLPTGHRLILSGMDAYNFFVEAAQGMSSASARIEAFWFAGKLPGQNLVEMWRIGNGQVVRTQAPWGKEWGGGPTSGWKLGSSGKHPVSMILEA